LALSWVTNASFIEPSTGRSSDDWALALSKPPFEVVGHGRDRGGVGRQHRRCSDEVRPEPSLSLEVGAGEVEKPGPLGQAEVGTANPAAAGRGEGGR
jgi:hypothetical protein